MPQTPSPAAPELDQVKIVGLARVSTAKQGESGLGLEAQQMAIEAYRRAHNGILIKLYVEIESGAHDSIDDRPQLRAAVAHAKRSRATLLIGKIDRLVRSVVISAYLKKSGVRIIPCDYPNADEMMFDFMVAFAAAEARRISVRTKEALASYKALGRVSKRIKLLYPDGVPPEIVEATAGKLGSHLPQCRPLTPGARALGTAKASEARSKQAAEAYADLAEYMHELRSGGRTLRAIADQLNADGQTTRRGRPWNPVQVKRVLDRFTKQTS